MELVHSDLIGPIKVPSINRAWYVLTFIEHRSRYPKCYFLMSKDSEVVLERFKEYKAWAENITERKIKILRTDGGREYINMHMKAYLKGHGIEHQHTVPYTPQQNGIAERFNRTVMERTRAILHSHICRQNFGLKYLILYVTYTQ
jgi:transposase InsO family protein